MTKGKLFRKLKEMRYDVRAKYVNTVKKEATEKEWWVLAELEIDDLLDKLNKELLTETAPNRLAMIAARIQGIQLVRKQIFDQWTLK